MKLTYEIYEEVKILLNEGFSIHHISKKLNISETTLKRKLEVDGLKYKGRRAAKRDNITLLKIKELRELGYSIERISKELNISYTPLLKLVKALCPNSKAIPKEQYRPINTKYLLNVNYFDTIDTEDKAYWLGFLMADGHLDHGRITIKLAFKDIEILENLKKCLDYTGNIKIEIRDTNFKKQSESAVLSIASVELVRKLSLYIPIGRKSNLIRFPDLQEDLIIHFIRGYFDGDGYVVKTRSLIGFCGNPIFIEELKLLLNINGGYQGKTDNYCELIYGKKSSKILADLMWKNANIYLNRKKHDYYSSL